MPRRAPAAILADYRRRRPAGDALRAFVSANFTLPAAPRPPRPAPATPLLRHIAATWDKLARAPVAATPGGSALPVPRPFVVPGGRFRELYYWDSYFTMLGLARDRRGALVEDMIDDFTALIERYGHVPNGTRSYYLSRSQPPAFYLMLDLSASRDRARLRRRLAALRREHAYWMAGARGLARGAAAAHVVRLPDGSLLNRYWDARDTPREESYAEDTATAADSPRDPAGVWRDLRAGAESVTAHPDFPQLETGWDYSTRWLADPAWLASIRTTELAPVDLNSLMAGMEHAIAEGCRRVRDRACAARYGARVDARTAAMRRWMWDPATGAYGDILWRTGRPTGILSAAAAAPLFAGVATPGQARVTAATIRARLLAPGGLRTTLAHSGQQWDGPNGWAPLQWIAVRGLERYGETALARTIATRWIATVTDDYRRRGRLVEKYDIERGRAGGGGEYVVQTGFGWTNGVTRALIADYGGTPATPVTLSPK